MFPYRRLAPGFKPCLLSVARPVASTSYVMQRRGLMSSVPRCTEPPSTTSVEAGEHASRGAMDEDNQFREMMTQQGNDTGPASYRQFLDEIGSKYKFAAPGLWLGDKVVEFVSHSFHAGDRSVHYCSIIALSHEPVVQTTTYIGCIG